MNDVAPRSMTLDEFVPLVDHDFTADCDPQPVKLRLVEASPLRPSAASLRPPFILVFRSAPEALLVAGAYKMKAPGFGPDLIFISDMTPPPQAEAGYYYQAIFN
jgi:hypothetical protein